MKNILIMTFIFVLLSGAAWAETITATVNGMVCAFCATGIEKTFEKQPAVQSVKVDLDTKKITIVTKPEQTLTDDTITSLIKDAGYVATDIERAKE